MAKLRIPEADRMHTFVCPDCDCVHLTLLDKRGEVFATMIVEPGVWDRIVSDVTRQRNAKALDAVGRAMGHG